MQFISIKIQANPEISEILVAELAEIGFDYFEDFSEGVEAFCESQNYNDALVLEIIKRYQPFDIQLIEKREIEKKNWNEEWEKNFTPVYINEDCEIRATFHPAKTNLKYDLIIEPKMSFGTGHHATTASVMRNMFSINHNKKKVLDVGCGTGILAILAEKLGAVDILAFDIDEWSVENTEENIALNACKEIKVVQGKLLEVKPAGLYDIILANINRNVLLAEIKEYSKLIKENGYLIVSGFYTQDEEDISNCAEQNQLLKTNMLVQDNWCSVIYFKNI